VSSGQGGVDPGVPQRGLVDVDRENLGTGCPLRDRDRSRRGPAADVDGPGDRLRASGHVGDRGIGHAVGVRSEEHRVGRVGRERRVDEQFAVVGGEPDPAAPEFAARFGRVGVPQQSAQGAGQNRGLERPAPAEHVAQIAGGGVRGPPVHALVGGRRDRREAIAGIFQRPTEPQERVVGCLRTLLTGLGGGVGRRHGAAHSRDRPR
jgi:hypothetical protein